MEDVADCCIEAHRLQPLAPGDHMPVPAHLWPLPDSLPGGAWPLILCVFSNHACMHVAMDYTAST